MNQVIDFSTLTWVKKELDETLKEARQSLEAHVDNPQDEAQLGFLAAHLHQVYGTLQMVELYGASLLAEEMEHVAKAIANEGVSRREDACDVLMRAILQLPDYLDRLIAGYRDIPLVLLPLLNDLRAVRGENLLSENSMFSPDLNARLPESVTRRNTEEDIQNHARNLRHRFQLGLLGWFRQSNTQQSLTSMADVLARLQDLSSNERLASLWWVAAGIADALKAEVLDSSVSVKRLMGQVDRQIKRITDDGEGALVQDMSEELLKNLLFYVAQSRGAGGPRIAEIQATYKLLDLLPGEEELAAARESLSGQNTDLFETVAIAVKEELGRLKDTLDLVLRGGCRDIQELQPLIGSLQSLGDTLGMLSLGAARKAVLSKAGDLQRYLDSGEVPADTLLMDVASTLLFVESSVDGMGRGRAVADGESQLEEQLAESEFNQVMDVVMQEAITDLIRAKEAIVSYIEAGNDTGALTEVPQWFSQVKGGLVLLGEMRAAALIDSVNRYIERELLQQRKHPPQQELDSLADAVCGLEYYLESRKDHRMYGGSAMTVAEESIDKLGYPSQEDAKLFDDLEFDQAADSAGAEAHEDNAAADPEENTDDDGIEATHGDGQEAAVTPASAGTEAASETGFTMPDETYSSEVAGEPSLGKLDGESADSESQAAPETEFQAEDAEAETVEEIQLQAPAEEPGPEAGAALSEAAVEEIPLEVPVVEPVLEAPAEQFEEEDDGLAIIGDEVDEEILEIFIEEAEEEMASIGEQLPVWLKDPENADALGSMRRSYHTLKGSGRLVGAMRIGEFAWAFENMLNRLIDGTVALTPEMTDLLQSASDTLPALVQQIKDGMPTRKPIAYLMRCADALSKGETMPGAHAEAEAAEDEVPEAPASAPVEPELELDETTLPADIDTGSGETAEIGQAVEEFDSAAEEMVYDGIMDPMLHGIFNAEAHGHLEVVRQFLNQATAGHALADEALARALHTLHGSAHMAEAAAIAELAGELERWIKALMESAQALSEDDCNVLQDSAAAIEYMLSSLPGELSEPETYNDLLSHIRSLYEAVADAGAEATPAADMSVPETAQGSYDDAELHADAGHYEEAESASDDPYAECDEELIEIFLEESAGNLEVSDSALHRWRESADDSEALAELQRALHTMKGGARMAELGSIGDLAHAAESLIIAIAEGRAGAGEEALHGVQLAHDSLAAMLDNVRHHQPVEPVEKLIEQLQALREHGPAEVTQVPTTPDAGPAEVESAPAEAKQAADDPYAESDPELLEVFLEEAGDIMEHSEQTLQNWKQSPQDQALIAELQRELHTLKGGARMADITHIGDLAHAVEALMVSVNEAEISPSEPMFSLLEQAHDRLVSMVDQVRHRQPMAGAAGMIAKLHALGEGGQIDGLVEAAEQAAGKGQSELSAVPAIAPDEAEHEDRRRQSRNTQELVRVKAKLLDNLVNYAGEVSIYRSRLEQQVGAYRFNLVEMDQTVSRVREQLRKLEIETEAQVLFRYEKEGEGADVDFDPLEMDRYSHMQQLSRSLVESVSDLGSIQNLLDNITRESETLLLQQSRVNTDLQEGLMRTRMVPFLGLAARMRRIIRQTCQELGKKAELELSGAEGEMDRTVVDRIVAPLEHMLRNAISHGIESPEQRKKSGKPESGTIRITLEREASDVVLRIADDGAGINLEAIRNKATERGLMRADSDLTDNDVLQFILETGFSTAQKVTQVAGRGVGMDVVNSEVKQLGGSLHIDSDAGKGTTFTVRLPFTLALNQALLIEVGEDTYAVPLSSIEGIVRMRREDLKAYYDEPTARFEYGGFEYEVRHLGSVLHTGKPHLDSGPSRMPVLLSRVGDHSVAFQVENLLGSREIVVKSVGPQISTVRGVSGATILGDGRVVMILDVAAMLRSGVTMEMAQVEDILHQQARTGRVTVMVVDDSITVRKVTTRLLERNDMNVIAAKDGVDAVSKLQENIPDIMLLDIEMPRMDGFELATHVRNEARLRNIPIIMITSRTGDKHRQRAMQIGVNRYLGKPFQESDLLENIQALLEEEKVNA